MNYEEELHEIEIDVWHPGSPPKDFKGSIHLFTITGCPYCKKVKTFLDERDLPFLEVNLNTNVDKHRMLVDRTGSHTVPQVFFNNKFVGGYEDLVSLGKSDLEDLISVTRRFPIESEDLFLNANIQNEPQVFQFSCEPDLYSKIVAEMKGPQGVDVKHRKYHLKSYKNVFIGRTAVRWLIDRGYATDEKSALDFGNKMMESHLFHHVHYDHCFKNQYLFYRFLEDTPSKALNAAEKLSSCEPTRPGVLSGTLRNMILQLYDTYLSKDGTAVDHEGLASSEEFKQYCTYAAELQRVQLIGLSYNEKLAFFINIYNSLVIHAQVVKGHPNNGWKRWRFFNRISYRIGGYVYSLNDIEHGILRSNKPVPMSFGPPFSPNDPRRQFILPMGEPRIHFALVCGAKSCPPIKVYDELNVNEQLTTAAQAFLESSATVDLNKREISLSKILDWYRLDFGKTDEALLLYVMCFITSERRDQIQKLMKSGRYAVTFQKYDWSLNG